MLTEASRGGHLNVANLLLKQQRVLASAHHSSSRSSKALGDRLRFPAGRKFNQRSGYQQHAAHSSQQSRGGQKSASAQPTENVSSSTQPANQVCVFVCVCVFVYVCACVCVCVCVCFCYMDGITMQLYTCTCMHVHVYTHVQCTYAHCICCSIIVCAVRTIHCLLTLSCRSAQVLVRTSSTPRLRGRRRPARPVQGVRGRRGERGNQGGPPNDRRSQTRHDTNRLPRGTRVKTFPLEIFYVWVPRGATQTNPHRTVGRQWTPVAATPLSQQMLMRSRCRQRMCWCSVCYRWLKLGQPLVRPLHPLSLPPFLLTV